MFKKWSRQLMWIACKCFTNKLHCDNISVQRVFTHLCSYSLWWRKPRGFVRAMVSCLFYIMMINSRPQFHGRVPFRVRYMTRSGKKEERGITSFLSWATTGQRQSNDRATMEERQDNEGATSDQWRFNDRAMIGQRQGIDRATTWRRQGNAVANDLETFIT